MSGKHANFTVETCTGTGATLALAGATAGKIPFSESFADGDLVAYSLEDSAGVIKVAGIGTYVSATDDITRNDTWNWNGTVIDDNPATNIALSGGTHVVRCDVTEDDLVDRAGFTLSEMTGNHMAMPDNWISVNDGTLNIAGADRVAYVPAYYASAVEINQLQVKVTTASATDVVQVGICTCGLDGLPDKIIEIVTVDVTAIGAINTSLAQAYKLSAGRYFVFSSSSDVTATFWNVESLTHAMRSGSYVFRYGKSGPLSAPSGAVLGIITTPLVAPTLAGDPNQSVMVLPRFV